MFLLRLKKLCRIILAPAFWLPMFKGVAAGTEHKFVLKGLNVEFIVDVGANRGQFALIARNLFPRAIIHSFEPLNEPANIFKSVFINDTNIILHICAIGCEQNNGIIHIAEDDDSSSMLPITTILSGIFPRLTEKEKRVVTVLPLSQAIGETSIPPLSLLKIDVQGFELQVLQGAEDILNKFLYLYIECSFIELYAGQALAYQVISWLQQRKFVLIGIYNMQYKNGKAIQGDFLFRKKEKETHKINA